MNLINTLILWIWVLGISLLIPTSLPAGGMQRTSIEKVENSSNSPLIALKGFNLLSTINKNPTILARVKAGTPVKVLKVWKTNEGSTWLLVNALSGSFYSLSYKRGWVNIGIY